MMHEYISTLLKDTKAIAATEFALIAPVLILILLGTFAAYDSNRALRHVTQTSTSLSDLATRVESMDNNKRDALFVTGRALLGSYATDDNYGIVVSSIVNEFGDDSDILSLGWSEAVGALHALETSDIDNLSLPVIPDGESVIIVEVHLNHNSLAPAGRVLHLQETAIRRPRFVSEVAYDL